MSMRIGKMPKAGDVVLVYAQFVNSFETKIRPAVVLYEHFSNIVLAGITSNVKMKGIPLSVTEGVYKPCVIKKYYVFTIAK